MDLTIITGGADTSEGEAVTTEATTAPAAAPVANLYTKATYIDLDVIDVNEASNVGRLTDADYGDVGALAASIIASGGLLKPVGVRATGGGRYALVFGYRRIRAFKRARAEGFNGKVFAAVLADGEGEAGLLAQVSENESVQEPLSFEGRLAAYSALKDAGYAPAAIAKRFGRAPDFVRDHFHVARSEVVAARVRLPEDDDKRLDFAVARMVARLDPKLHEAGVKVVTGLSVVKARAAVAKLRDGAEGEDAPEGEGEGEPTEGEPKPKAPRADKLAAFKAEVAAALCADLARLAALVSGDAAAIVRGLDQKVLDLCGEDAVNAATNAATDAEAVRTLLAVTAPTTETLYPVEPPEDDGYEAF